jgi:hypothetical protein
MLMEMIGAEWARRRAQLGATVAMYVLLPLASALVFLRPRGGSMELASLAHASFRVALLVMAATWGAGVWAPEWKGRWVYFLSLPVDRARLFALRYLAGLVWLALPVGALAATAWWAAAVVGPRLPNGVYAYPGPLSAWAVLATWFVYTAGFVLAARWEHPMRIALVPISAVALFLVLATAGVAPGVAGPALEEMFFGGFTPLAVFSVPSLIGY